MRLILEKRVIIGKREGGLAHALFFFFIEFFIEQV